MQNLIGRKAKIHEHGYVQVIDIMGSDKAVEDAARTSYDPDNLEGRKKSDTTGLIRYLMKHHHETPFEMCQVVLQVKAPIFVVRQWFRHRTASYNEQSARYTVMKDDCYIPDVPYIGLKAKNNKQGRDLSTRSPDQWAEKMQDNMIDSSKSSLEAYNAMIDHDLAPEIARNVLPVNIYTTFRMSMNLRNLLHFLHLRTDHHAQVEIRDYAEVIEDVVRAAFPITYEAWYDYVKHAQTFSRLEMDFIRKHLAKTAMKEDLDTAEPELGIIGLSKREKSDLVSAVAKDVYSYGCNELYYDPKWLKD